jgi:hypothetical protein
VNIKRTDALKDRLHRTTSAVDRQASPGGAFETDESDGRALSNSPVSRRRPLHQTSGSSC